MILTAVQEAAARDARPMSRAAFVSAFAALGYRVDFDAQADCLARYMTGPRAGEAYPQRTFGVREADTGRSAFHYESRRDDRFAAMQALRLHAYYLAAGRICEA